MRFVRWIVLPFVAIFVYFAIYALGNVLLLSLGQGHGSFLHLRGIVDSPWVQIRQAAELIIGPVVSMLACVRTAPTHKGRTAIFVAVLFTLVFTIEACGVAVMVSKGVPGVHPLADAGVLLVAVVSVWASAMVVRKRMESDPSPGM